MTSETRQRQHRKRRIRTGEELNASIESTALSETGANDGEPLLYEEPARYDLWFKCVLAAALLLTLISGIVVTSRGNTSEAIILFGVTVFDAALFYFVMPRKYQIYKDRLRIVFGRPLAFNAKLKSIAEAKPAPRKRMLTYSGLRFATSMKTVVEITRPKGFSMVISPTNREAFLRALWRALPADRDKVVPVFDWKTMFKKDDK